jgi:LPPG:FO 2-phospho-L-lactate transferase
VNESWNAIENAKRLGGPGWFNLGDHDLGTHLERTRRLREGQCLSEITRDFCKAWGIQHTVLPMTDSQVRTMVQTNNGELAFQEYFVHQRCEPQVKGFRFDGANQAEPAPGAIEAIHSADAVVFCPSNPWVSIDPILRVLPKIGKPVFAVSPIIGGDTVKGPAAKMYRELGIDPSAFAVARHYQGLLTGFVLDEVDKQLEGDVMGLRIKTLVTNTLMKSHDDRSRLAQDLLGFIGNNL